MKKHFLSTIKEWSHGLYKFNRNNEKLSMLKDKNLNLILKSYFNLTLKNKSIRKSKRMRDLIRRSSTKRFFLSNAEIKENNDKINVTIYAFDRQKDSYIKQIYQLNKSLKNINKYDNLGTDKLYKNKLNSWKKFVTTCKNTLFRNVNIYTKKHLGKRILFKLTKRNINYFNNLQKSYFNNIKRRSVIRARKKRIMNKRKFIMMNNLINVLPMSFNVRKIKMLKIIFNHFFVIWALAGLNIKTYNVKNTFLIGKRDVIARIKSTNNVHSALLLEKDDMEKLSIFHVNKRWNKASNLSMLNLKLLSILYNILKESYNTNNLKNKDLNIFIEEKVQALYKQFSIKYTKEIFKNSLLREILVVIYLYRLSVTRLKYTTIISNLKHIIKKVYDKSISITIINLKYLHMNSDIFINAITTKLANKKNKITKVIKRSLGLVKMPVKQLNVSTTITKNKRKLNYNRIKTIFFSDTKFIQNKENIKKKHSLKNYLLPHLSNELSNVKIKLRKNINSLKYKWSTGIRLEAKGRLSARYAAGRALYGYRFKGGMRNLKKLNNRDVLNRSILRNSPSTILFRGLLIPNVQYKKSKGSRRIGAFGVRLWLNSN